MTSGCSRKMFAVDEGIVEIADPQIVDAVHFQKVARERLEKQSAKQHETRFHVVGVRLDEIGPRGFQFGGDIHFLLVAQDVHFEWVALELALDDLGHLDAVAVDLDEAVAGHPIVVQREDHVADLEHAVAGAARERWRPRGCRCRRPSSPGRRVPRGFEGGRA